MKSDLFVKRFREEMENRGMKTVYDVAPHCRGVSMCIIGDCMFGGKLPSAKKLAVICSSLGLSADYLLGFTDENKQPMLQNDFESKEYASLVQKRALALAPFYSRISGVCREAGVSRSDFLRLRCSGLFPTLEKCIKIAKYYGVGMDWLLCLSEEGGPEE